MVLLVGGALIAALAQTPARPGDPRSDETPRSVREVVVRYDRYLEFAGLRLEAWKLLRRQVEGQP